MGIRKKITICFATLALLVAGAGAVSFSELMRIGDETRRILDASNRNMNLSRRLLDGAETMHIATLQLYAERGGGGKHLAAAPSTHDEDSLYRAGRTMFAAALDEGKNAGETAMESVEKALGRYLLVAERYLASPEGHLGRDWLRAEYWKAYTDLSPAIKEYMTGAEYNLGGHADALRHNAYRAITPALVTLGVVLVLVVMLWYLLDIYYVKPVVAMNRATREWIQQGTPFNVKVEGRDETGELRENILELLARIRRSSAKQE